MSSKCKVRSREKRESHASCVYIVGSGVCEDQKRRGAYGTECRHVSRSEIYSIKACVYVCVWGGGWRWRGGGGAGACVRDGV